MARRKNDDPTTTRTNHSDIHRQIEEADDGRIPQGDDPPRGANATEPEGSEADDGTVQELGEQEEDLHNALTRAQEAIDRIDGSVRGYDRRLAEAQTAIDDFKRELGEWKTSLTTRERQEADTRETLATMQAELAGLRSTLTELQANTPIPPLSSDPPPTTISSPISTPIQDSGPAPPDSEPEAPEPKPRRLRFV